MVTRSSRLWRGGLEEEEEEEEEEWSGHGCMATRKHDGQ